MCSVSFWPLGGPRFSLNFDQESHNVESVGKVTLSPNGIRDTESVWDCYTSFLVFSGNPNRLNCPTYSKTVLRADTATLIALSPGDMFMIPPGSCYLARNLIYNLL